MKHTYYTIIRPFLILWIGLFLGFINVGAQTLSDATIPVPDFDVEFLQNEQAALSEMTSLTAEQISLASDGYKLAQNALEEATQQLDLAARFQQEFDAAPQTIERLESEIRKEENRSPIQAETDTGELTGEALLQLNRDLTAKESQLQTLRAEAKSLKETEQHLLQRPISEELSEARTGLAEITTQIEALGDGERDPLVRVRRYSLEARQYYLRAQILALEREMAGLSSRQQTLVLNQDLIHLKIQKLEDDVSYLQKRTGHWRVAEAYAFHREAQNIVSLLEKSHPFLSHYAVTTLEYSQKLTHLATRSSRSPQQQVDARNLRDLIQSDLAAAAQLTSLDTINRQSSQTLRRMRNQRPSVKGLKADLDATHKDIVDAMQERLWAQEQLRLNPRGQFQVERMMEDWLADNPYARPLMGGELDILKSLQTERRKMLLEISEVAFDWITEANQLQAIQAETLDFNIQLGQQLDKTLLWLPSVAAVDRHWPERIFRGIGDVFNLRNLTYIAEVLWEQIRHNILALIAAIMLIGFLFFIPSHLRKDIKRRSTLVGKVQTDSYWHTPAVILDSAIIALPLPLCLLFLGFLFKSSAASDTLIVALGNIGFGLAGFVWFCLTWLEWARSSNLFDSHFGVPAFLRHNMIRNLRWFTPIAALTIALVILTQDSREADVYEGLSLFVFILTALALSFLVYRLLGINGARLKSVLGEHSRGWRYRRVIVIFVLGLPFLAAVFAAIGFYDTARELLSRLFLSYALIICAYVIYGVIRRTVLIAQRRFALKQAIERREALIKARQNEMESEEAVETSVPEFEDIDVEALSRQSARLLGTVMLLGLAVMMWILWRDLLPALSVFDNVKLWSQTVVDQDGGSVQEWVTLWNLIQSLAILALTIIAAKNLPGLLEVFVLNRSNLDKGIRYAIVSILGYIIVAIGVIQVFNTLGMEWSQLQWIVAALGVGIGFGLQEIIANFISGLVILFERPIRLGDYVSIGDSDGTVSRIQIRATTLRDLDNREIFIPNKALITEKVTNWTLSNAITRLKIPVGIAYGSDTEQARKIMMDVITANENVMDKPSPQALFIEFGDSSLNFEIRAYLKNFEDRFGVQNAIITELNSAFEAAGISIPYPQRDIHIITQPGTNPAQKPDG